MKNKPKKNQLRIELIAVVLLKIALIYLIWWVCFSHPPHITQTSFVDHVLNVKPASP